jgi:hypothetical protein
MPTLPTTFCAKHPWHYKDHCPLCDSAALDRVCDTAAMEFFDGTGDIMAVSHSIRMVILARFEWVAKHGKDAGE